VPFGVSFPWSSTQCGVMPKGNHLIVMALVAVVVVVGYEKFVKKA
jgi:hypothetical protein